MAVSMTTVCALVKLVMLSPLCKSTGKRESKHKSMYLYFPPLPRAAGVPAGRRRYLSLIDTTVSLYPRTGGVTCISPIQTTVISLRLSALILLLLSHDFLTIPARQF